MRTHRPISKKKSFQIFNLQTDEERASAWHNEQKYIFIRNIVRFASEDHSIQEFFCNSYPQKNGHLGFTPYISLRRPNIRSHNLAFSTFALRSHLSPEDILWSEHFTTPEVFMSENFDFPGKNEKLKYGMTFSLRGRIVDGWHVCAGHLRKGMREFVKETGFYELVYGSRWHRKGEKASGKWGYVSEQRKVKLLDGLFVHKCGIKTGGKRKYCPQLKGTYLENGWIEYPSGKRAEGKWEYLSEMNSLYLKEGKMRMENGDIWEGKFIDWKFEESTFKFQGNVSLESSAEEKKGLFLCEENCDNFTIVEELA